MNNSDTILFYSTRSKYGFLSNFSNHGFKLGEKYYKTSEHYFQSQKFFGINPDYAEVIRRSPTPHQAAKLGRSRQFKIREDWNEIKIQVMIEAVTFKFVHNKDIRKILLETGNRKLVEKSPRDAFWGCGKDGTGRNMLGIILMDVRTHFQKVHNGK